MKVISLSFPSPSPFYSEHSFLSAVEDSNQAEGWAPSAWWVCGLSNSIICNGWEPCQTSISSDSSEKQGNTVRFHLLNGLQINWVPHGPECCMVFLLTYCTTFKNSTNDSFLNKDGISSSSFELTSQLGPTHHIKCINRNLGYKKMKW